MADSEILNFHSKKTAFRQHSKLEILPVRCQTNTLLISEGKKRAEFFDHSSTLILTYLNFRPAFWRMVYCHFTNFEIAYLIITKEDVTSFFMSIHQSEVVIEIQSIKTYKKYNKSIHTRLSMYVHIPHLSSSIYLFSVKRRANVGASYISMPLKLKKQFI